MAITQALGGKDKQITRNHWPACFVVMQAYNIERLCHRAIWQKYLKEYTVLCLPLHGSTPTYQLDNTYIHRDRHTYYTFMNFILITKEKLLLLSLLADHLCSVSINLLSMILKLHYCLYN